MTVLRGPQTRMFVRGGLAVATVLAMTASAAAFYPRLAPWNWSCSPATYYPSPVVYWGPSYCTPVVGQPLFMPYAQPLAAPPSEKKNAGTGMQSTEPPTQSNSKQPPKIVESRSLGGAQVTSKDQDRCKVGFWNVSGKDVSLTIDGQAKTLAKNRALTVELGRVFVWQIDQREPTTEQVPADQAFYEVIIRQ